MLLAIGLFAGAAILELCLWLLPASQARRIVAELVIVVLLLTTVGMFIARPSPTCVILAIMSLYRVCNLLRIITARMHEKYLRRSAFQSSVWIIGMQALLLLAWTLVTYSRSKPGLIFSVMASTSLAVSLILFVSTIRHLRTTRPPRFAAEGIADRDLPTVTVCIPARNETDNLEACLQSLVASNYPKLEVLVLDDCSQDRRTPEIIRGFAHDGVRFIPGSPPDDSWLAKNLAYQRLFEESNGELLLFCGVDVQFQPNSLRLLVETLLTKKKSMLSVMPQNSVPSVVRDGSSSLVQPMRYAWELALPRRLFQRPPVLSTCWLIKREIVQSAGGFAAVSRSIVPESYFARVSTVHDGYTFMRSDDRIGIISNKSFSEQRATAVRTRYPQVHRRMELVLICTLIELICLVLPYVLVVACLLSHGSHDLLVISAAAVIMLTLMYTAIVTLTYRVTLARSLILLPFAALFDVWLLNYSMIMYEFFSVEWKGRNVCIPVMRVVNSMTAPSEFSAHPTDS